ncbi:MAG: aminotransferase class I/II-fold pyridoxal phosphate-dependent enzyme, partial [Myxococcota bacterium]
MQVPDFRPLTDFATSDEPDLFAKTDGFAVYVDQLRRAGVYQVLHRLELTGPLDHRIRVRDPFGAGERELVCFDSNSYLGLHLHPRVVGAMHAAIDEVGAGTPSAQVLGGYNRHLRHLEERLAALHGRQDTLVFPSGYQANIGILTGLLRRGDLVLVDAFSHASLQDGCHYSGAKVARYAHGDLDHAEALLSELRPHAHSALVVTDGLFSMHGDLADVPGLLELARRHDARLMVDDAHGLGVLGASGRGIEEHWDCEGEVDLMMGTFSKALGLAGGYLSAEQRIIDYLRYFARAGLFTASLPGPVCAALAESLAVIADEPALRHDLHANTDVLAHGFREAGLTVPDSPTPIVPVLVEDEGKLPGLARDLFEHRIKAGIVQYPAVPKGAAMLRFTVNA